MDKSFWRKAVIKLKIIHIDFNGLYDKMFGINHINHIDLIWIKEEIL